MTNLQLSALSKQQYEVIGRDGANQLRRAASSINSDWKAEILRDLIDPLLVRSILDFGCGQAQVSHALAQGWKIDTYVGIDLSTEQLKFAAGEWPKGRFIVGNEASLSSLRETFDLAMLVDIIEHIEKPISLLSDIRDVAKHVVIKVPLERTRFNIITSSLGLKRRHSRRYERCGHIHEWDLSRFLSILSAARLKPIRWIIKTPTRLMLFNEPTKQLMLRKPRLKGLVNAALYRVLWFVPFQFIRFAYSCYIGTDLFILCRPRRSLARRQLRGFKVGNQ